MQQNRKGWKGMVDYMLAIKRPFSSAKDFFIGALMYVIPVVSIITGMFAAGYVLRCAKSAMKMDFFLPEWDRWGDLFVKGLLSFLISILYALPLIIVSVLLIIFLFGTSLTALAEAEDPAQAIAILGSGAIIVAVCILLMFYVLPAALVRFAATERFGEAFALGAILKGAFTGNYALTFLAILVYDIIIVALVGAVSYVLSLVLVSIVPDIVMTIIVSIIGAAASFVMGVTTMTAFGEWYGEAGGM